MKHLKLVCDLCLEESNYANIGIGSAYRSIQSICGRLTPLGKIEICGNCVKKLVEYGLTRIRKTETK